MIGNSIDSVQPECRYFTDDEILRQYVAGRLPEPAAEEFEQHLFECQRCADEVQRAIELRAVMTGSRASRRNRSRSYSLLALAAVVVGMAIGLWQLRLRQEPSSPPPLRSAVAREISASGRVAGGVFSASWKAVPNARSYRVQVFNAIGEPIASAETKETAFSTPQTRGQFWKVQALDDDGVVIASSELIKIGSR